VGGSEKWSRKSEKILTNLQLTRIFGLFNTFQFAHAYARGEGMKHYVNMVGAGYFDDVTTVIQGGSSSVKALTGSTEEEQFH
jgi:isocitrate lyase